jgi:hypothetical protein
MSDTFRAAVIGARIVDAGYLDDNGAVPCLILDNGQIITASRDDEGNGPGVLVANEEMLCETSVAR